MSARRLPPSDLRKFGSSRIRGEVYLTFDDGPDAEWTPRVLDVLAAAQARATFFVVGQCGARRTGARAPHRGRRARDRQPQLQPSAPLGDARGDARSEVRDGAAAIADIAGQSAAGVSAAARPTAPMHGRRGGAGRPAHRAVEPERGRLGTARGCSRASRHGCAQSARATSSSCTTGGGAAIVPTSCCRCCRGLLAEMTSAD